MRCSSCEAEGLTSRVYPGACYTTDMYFPPFYDEAGVYHSHDGNPVTTSYECSNGHRWSASCHRPCPAPNCEWNELKVDAA